MKKQHRIALVDCNNFYVSCERVFRPDLWGKPVAVLSNNDGCIVARSQEVKDLDIKMATPVYQVQHLIKRHRVQLFSSNYALYADMSNRVMQCLEAFTPHIEVYSIDESFLDLSGFTHLDLTDYGRLMKKTVLRATGIPVGVGIGPTKTLAKLANYAAKKWHKTGGVVDLSCPVRREKLLHRVPVDEVWGVGSRTAKRLQQLGVHSAYDLSVQAVEQVQTQFNIVMARTVMELNGVVCLSLDDVVPDKQQIVCSRSFKRRLTRYDELADALSSFCNRAAEKLRQQHSVAGSITVFIRTNPFNPDEPQYQRSAFSMLEQRTQDSRRIISTAKRLLKESFKAGYRFQKCGVQLGHIRPQSIPDQMDLFAPEQHKGAGSEVLMAAVDRINRRFHKGIAVSTAGINEGWQFQVQRLSSRYTTDWNQLAVVKCK